MYDEILRALLDYIIDNVRTLVSGKYAKVTYVNNSLFPDGAYRIHMDDFIPAFLRQRSDIHELSQLVLRHEYNGVVKFDLQTLWLTFYTNKE